MSKNAKNDNGTFIGVDPGLSGAAAVFDPQGESGILEVADMPLAQPDKKAVNAPALAEILIGWVLKYNCRDATIERVHTMPEQGIASSGRMMSAYGVATGVLAGLGIPTRHVLPNRWKPALRLPGGAHNKDKSRERASKMFPKATHHWPRKKDHGRAEAALLAYLGFMTMSAKGRV